MSLKSFFGPGGVGVVLVLEGEWWKKHCLGFNKNAWLHDVFRDFIFFTPTTWGNDPISQIFFTTGLVQPPTSWLLGLIRVFHQHRITESFICLKQFRI